MREVLSAAAVSKSYGSFVALERADFRLEAGRTLGVVGESGSGKSTLVRVCMGITPATSGEVRVVGETVRPHSRSDARRRSRQIQLVPQDPRTSLNPMLSVETSLAFQLSAQRYAHDRRSRMIDTLALLGLAPEFLDAFPFELSGGQAQRIAIARAIMTRPQVLVCDEAVSALDKSVQAQVLNCLMDLQSDTGVALLFISHDLAVVEHVADDILVLDRGRVVESGDTRRVLADPADPYTRELLAARSSI